MFEANSNPLIKKSNATKFLALLFKKRNWLVLISIVQIGVNSLGKFNLQEGCSVVVFINN